MRDVMEAVVVRDSEPLYGVILAFNVKVLPDAEEEAERRRVKIFRHNVIYHLIDEYLKWMRSEREARARREFERLVKPAKIKVLEGYIFRRAKPAIVGVEVSAGKIRPKVRLINENDIEAAGIEILVGFKGAKPVPLNIYTQSGGERSTAIMAFLLALQQHVRSPFRAVDEYDIHMDEKTVN